MSYLKDNQSKSRNWLWILNIVAFIAHGIQTIVMGALIAKQPDHSIDYNVVDTHLTGPPDTTVDLHVIGPMRPIWIVFSFILLCCISHGLVLWNWSSYEENIEKKYNPYRWIEYSVSSTLMILVICSVTGIRDIAALLGLAGCNLSMILFGDLFDQGHTKLKPFFYGCIAGVIPWIAIFTYVGFIGKRHTMVCAYDLHFHFLYV
jgi:hypothetical protein